MRCWPAPGRNIPEWAGKRSKYMQWQGGEASYGLMQKVHHELRRLSRNVILSEEDRPHAGDADESKDPYHLSSDCYFGFYLHQIPNPL